ncbi:hypothetical protein NicSoilE8_16890 [Arthrobacter sp. NicSoilE8]|nr:hypothetical protein NicSoilE8_16890 [Arthrobacter sp. NicSoilE8]
MTEAEFINMRNLFTESHDNPKDGASMTEEDLAVMLGRYAYEQFPYQSSVMEELARPYTDQTERHATDSTINRTVLGLGSAHETNLGGCRRCPAGHFTQRMRPDVRSKRTKPIGLTYAHQIPNRTSA